MRWMAASDPEAHDLYLQGRFLSALAVIGRLAERAQREYVMPYGIALGYVGLGDTDRPLGCLERSADLRDSNVALYLLTDPLRRVGLD